jgi:glycosyltransferase involved in cell wall biosynthesis
MAFYYYALFQQRLKEGDVYLVNDLSPGAAPYRNKPTVQIAHHLPSSELSQPPVNARARVGLTLLASLERRAFKRARVIICQSEDTMQMTRLRYPEETGKLTMIPNGVDVELFKPVDDERTDDGGEDTPLILCVARGLEARKGISYLIEAFAATQRVAGAKLVIIGKDSQGLKRHILGRVRALGVANTVTFIDSVPMNDLIDLYRRATLTVVPSLLEGFSKPALESMACGTPVIGSAVGAMPELVDERSGVLVPPGDAQSLTAALIDLLRDRGRTTRMGVAARGRATAYFAWDVIARKVLDVCEAAASG